MSAPVFVAAAESAFAVATQSPVVNYPTVQAGDILLAIFSTNTTANANGTPPAGWTLLVELDEVLSDSTGVVFWKRADGTEPASETWTNLFDATELGVSVVVAYRGCVASGSPVDASYAVWLTLFTSVPFGPLTTSVRDVRVVNIATADPTTSAQTFTWSSPAVERVVSMGAGGSSFISVSDQVQSVPGDASSSGTWAPAGDQTCRFMFGLKPLAATMPVIQIGDQINSDLRLVKRSTYV